MMNRTFLDVHPEVAEALANNRAVVALESTIISHGMPWPDNWPAQKDLNRLLGRTAPCQRLLRCMTGRSKSGSRT